MPMIEITDSYIRQTLKVREEDAHKGNFGKVLIFAGSVGMAGAAILCGRAALRSGAGLVRFLLPDASCPLYPVLQTAVPEATCVFSDAGPDFAEYDAIAADYRVYTILGDGEIQEGQVWEAAMFAAHYQLGNLIAIVDNNNLQIDGDVRDVAGLVNIAAKFQAFGWQTMEVDGNDVAAVQVALAAAVALSGQPVCIVAKTVTGLVGAIYNNVSGYFSDSLSYSRLMALMLAGAVIAQVFNTLGR